MSLSTEAVEAAVVGSGFAVVERDTNGAFGSWYLTLEHDPRLRLTFDGRDGWLTIEWETDRFFGDLRQWDPLWVGKSSEDLKVPMVMRMLESARGFAEAARETHGRR